MPSTIGWLAVAIAAGSLLGLVADRWAMVASWLHRCLEDPVGRAHVADGDASIVDKRAGRTR